MSTEEGTIVHYNTEEWATVNTSLGTLKTELDALADTLTTTVTETLMTTGIDPESATGKALVQSFATNVTAEITNFSTEIGNFVSKSETDQGEAVTASEKAVAAANGE